jgi:hypothetical protein
LFRKAALEQVELEMPYHPKDETIHREFKLRLKRLGDGPVALTICTGIYGAFIWRWLVD